MPVNNEKDAYGRAVDASVGKAGDILKKMFPGTSATLRGSGEDIATSRSLPEAAGATVRGAAALPVALADDVFGGAYRALSGPASGFVQGLTGGEAQASPPAAPRSARQILSFNTGEGGAPAFPGAVARADRPATPPSAADILKGGRVSTVDTLGTKGYLEMAERLKAINDDIAYRRAELQDGRQPPGMQGGGNSALDVIAKQEARNAGTIDNSALGRIGTPGTQVEALQRLGVTNRATAEALLKALDADTSSAPQRNQNEIVKRLLGEKASPEQAQQLRNTLLALMGKTPASPFVLAEQSSTDATGSVNKVPVAFNQNTGQFLTQVGQASVAAPNGMKQIGTSGGKPVYEDANGNRFIGE